MAAFIILTSFVFGTLFFTQKTVEKNYECVRYKTPSKKTNKAFCVKYKQINKEVSNE